MAVKTTFQRLTSVQLALELWAFRSSSSSAPEVDSMVTSRNPDDCDTMVLRQEQSLFMSLPVELLLHIASYLEANDEACLTLSCKRATCALGLSSWKQIGRGRECYLERRAVSQLRWNFLRALENDLPNHLCHFCEIFLKATHVNHSRHSSNYQKNLDVCRRTNLSKVFESYSPYSRIATKLSFCDVQMILKAASLEDYTSDHSLENLHISTPWQRTSSWTHRHITYLMKQDERPLIHNNELYMYTCSRRWALCTVEDMKDKTPRPQFFVDMTICRHQLLDVHEKAIHSAILSLVLKASAGDILDLEHQPVVSLPFGCPRCPIECRYTIFNHGPNAGLELALEVGHVLGSATRLHDMEWSSRGPPEWQRYSFDEEPMFDHIPFNDRSRFTRSRTDPSLMQSHLLHKRIEELNGPKVLKEPGKVLELLSPDGAVNAFDPEALSLARAQRTAMWTYAREQDEKSPVMQERLTSKWQRFSARWSGGQN